MIEPGTALFAQLLALNNDHATELSYTDDARLTHLIGSAYLANAAPDGSALLISFDQGGNYDSENFLWFRARYPTFVYIDRVVVAVSARGKGIAKRLYEELFSQAIADGHRRIVCEVNSDPPNPGSDAFHAALGFFEVGAQKLSARNKSVRYLLKEI